MSTNTETLESAPKAETTVPDLLLEKKDKGMELGLQLVLSPEASEKLRELAKAKRAKPERFAEAAAKALLEGMLDGGLMLSRSKLGYLEQRLKTQIGSVDRLLDVIDAAAQVGEGEFRFLCDPSWRAAIEEQICRPQCRTFLQVMQDVMEMVMTNDWAYHLTFEGGTVAMTAVERAELEALLGGKVTAAGILKALKRGK